MRSTKNFSLLLLAGAVAWPSLVHAYRPFDSTDPAVADVKEFEIELSPASLRKARSQQTWIAPQLRLNYGFAPNWEVVLEGQGEHMRGSESTLVDNALSLKTVIREGSLQDRPGASVALELGALLPGLHDENGMGAAFAWITGQKWSWGAMHFNVATELTRDQRAELFLGTILEGPESWTVRPVAELVYVREFGIKEEVAALAGIIWQVKNSLAFDLAMRHASVGGDPETEIRAGLTFAFSWR